MFWSLRRVGKVSVVAFEEGRLCEEAFIGVGGRVFSEGSGRGEWGKGFMRIFRDLLKAGVVSQVDVAEGVNGGVETKVVCQGVGSRSRGGVFRVREG